MQEETPSPQRSSPVSEHDYSEEQKKSNKLDLNFNNVNENTVSSWKFEEKNEPFQVKYIPFRISEKKIVKHPTIKKLYQEEEEIAVVVKKTKFNEYFQYIFQRFFSKNELLKFINHVRKVNEFDFLTYIEIGKSKENSRKKELVALCTNLINKIAYK
jgi:hypothetical protein